MVSAGGESRVPPEMSWTPTPPVSGRITASETQVVSTAQQQVSDIPRAVAVPASDEDAMYRLVNATAHDD
jgi:hypothetical protein